MYICRCNDDIMKNITGENTSMVYMDIYISLSLYLYISVYINVCVCVCVCMYIDMNIGIRVYT